MVRTILVVDDERHVARVLTVALERAGYTVETARNGEEAVIKLVELKPDALLTDIMMPRMNGRELVAVVCNQFPDRPVPIVVMTSSLELEHRDWVKNYSDLHFIEKPVSPRRIIQILDKYFSATDIDEPGHESLRTV
jgi:chemosensory pili system protein ChpA (sensor histidine kinase/response regulator)